MKINRLLQQFLLVSVLAFGLQAAVQAQSPTPYGNEWIDYNKTYYKLKVVNTGLHRLSHGFLDSLGLAGTNPQHFQLFRRGKEVAIHVAGEADGRLDREDFIEFYGERNDGRLDQDLYKNPAHQLHQLYSLYTDTAAYFLTVNPAGGKRMQQVNLSPGGKTPEPYHMQWVTQYFAGRYHTGRKYGATNSLHAWMDEGEGYFSFIGTSDYGSKSYDITGISGLVSTGPKPTLEYALGTVGTNNSQTHHFNVNLTLPNGSTKLLSRFQVSGDGYAKGKSTLEFSDVHSAGKVVLQTEQKSDKSRLPISYTKLVFPQKTAVTGNSLVFFTDSTRAINPYFEVIGASASSIAYDISDPYNPVVIQGHISGLNKGFVIPTQDRTHKILLVNLPKYLKPVSKPEVNTFRKVDAAAHDYIILTNKRLMKPIAGAQRSAPAEFASYRASAAGGGYDTLLMHMDQVVDQFHYGEFSSNAIRKFMSYMLTSDRPKHLFIIGKGAKYAWDDYTSFPADKPAGKYSFYHIDARYPKVHELDLVPTGMIPSSDVFFTADFRNERFEPRVPTGRLAATEPSDIIAYLNKVKEYEALPEGLEWRKNMLQLGGGGDQGQITKFTNFLKTYKQIAEGVFFGGNVLEKYRQNVSDIVSVINVSDEVNTGLSYITFFGHSSASTTDLDIGFVSANIYGYRNKGKYPIIIMNGCYSGDAFIFNRKTFGEDWLLTPDRGAISFMSQSYIGGDEPLHDYTHNYYKIAFQDELFYGKTIGEIQKEVAKRYPIPALHDKRHEYIATVTQMVLQGDPAIRPYSPSKPDYKFTNNTFEITDQFGEVLNASSDKVVLRVNVDNLGKAISDSLNISVKRVLADSRELEPVLFKVKPIFKKDQIELTLPNVGSVTSGLNTFEIALDYNNNIDELDESNNILKVQHFIPRSGISVLAPADYAIIKEAEVKLVVQSTQLNTEPKGVYFELDTTQQFNSPIIKAYKAPPGALPVWDVSLPLHGPDLDSTVFYWRARFAEFAQEEDTVWVQSSFRYIENGTSGWSQSHVGQFKQASKNKVVLNSGDNKWEFGELYRNIDIRIVGGDIPYDQPPYGVFINGVNQIDNACGNFRASSRTPRMYFFVLNQQELSNVRVTGFNPCQFMDNLYQFVVNTASGRLNMQRFINAIPEGSYVIAVTVHAVPFNDFSQELKSSFRNLGSKLIDEVGNGYPLAIVGQKGSLPGSAQELTADIKDEKTPATSQEILMRASVNTRTTQGTIASTTIGPALSWGSLHHNIERYKAGNDSYKLSLFGINAEGNRELIHENITSKTFDLSKVRAEQFPHLQLQAHLSDTEDRTAPQLKQWMVYYQAVPEGVVRPDLVEVNEKIVTEQAGRGIINVPMAFQNVTPYAFRDSITVEVTVTGEGMEPKVSKFKIEALEGNKTAHFNYSMSTLDLGGSYKLSMYVNPQLQPEQQYQNNIYEVNFAVKSKLHPIMDVAFDGIHIMDGELVAPSPLISITMKDENKHVFLENPDAMEVYLEGPNIQGQYDVKKEAKPGEVHVSPADEKNDFRFEYKPERLENGLYTLTVRGKDASGKSSGSKDYKINFLVENESKITNFYPYPNPFSSKTQFIFTLTGGVIPNDFKIQIMTVTGKIVKEIMREEIGPIRIGNNKTEYAWDGTDMYGDKLANGVYLYRVVMPKDTEEMKHIWKKGDKGFVNGYGKIYILR